MQHLRM